MAKPIDYHRVYTFISKLNEDEYAREGSMGELEQKSEGPAKADKGALSPLNGQESFSSQNISVSPLEGPRINAQMREGGSFRGQSADFAGKNSEEGVQRKLREYNNTVARQNQKQ